MPSARLHSVHSTFQPYFLMPVFALPAALSAEAENSSWAAAIDNPPHHSPAPSFEFESLEELPFLAG